MGVHFWNFAICDDVTQSVLTSPDDVSWLCALCSLEAAFKPVTGHIRIHSGMPTELSYGTHTLRLGDVTRGHLSFLFFRIAK